jgi:hypothetical protein
MLKETGDFVELDVTGRVLVGRIRAQVTRVGTWDYCGNEKGFFATILSFPCQYQPTSAPKSYSFTYHRPYTILAVEKVVKKTIFSPPPPVSKIRIEHTDCERVEWINMAQDMDQLYTRVYMAMNIRVVQNTANFLDSLSDY